MNENEIGKIQIQFRMAGHVVNSVIYVERDNSCAATFTITKINSFQMPAFVEILRQSPLMFLPK